MPALFVVSTTTFSGKTAVIAALMKHLLKEGKKPGYLKPVSTTPDIAGRKLADTDAQFIKRTFKLPAALNKIVPVKLTASTVEQAFRTDQGFPAQIKAAYDDISRDCDVLLVEGCGDLAEGALFGLSKPEIADMLDLPILVVTRHIGRLTGEDLILAKRILGRRFIGGLINAVPRSEFDFFSDTVVSNLEERGVPVLGVLPRQRLLTAATVQELADGISGEILIGEEHTDALVENLMVGAMGVSQALRHLRRKPNKAVITGGDRSDIHLAALETSTRCLILTGNLHPDPKIIAQAEEQGVPIILSKQSTLETVETINQFFGRTRFHQAQKLDQFQQIFDAAFDYGRLYDVMGLGA